MAKAKTVFFCSECGGESVRWAGKCPYCGHWNTLVEQKVEDKTAVGRVNMAPRKPQPINQITADRHNRFVLGLSELDTVLGGGLMPGSSVLLGGEPGIGKSTLLLQAAARMADFGPVLYVSAEEAAEQIKLRFDRLCGGEESASAGQLYLLAQTDIHAALAAAEEIGPALLILDSVQALFSPDLDSAAGSVSQVRAVTAAAIDVARRRHSAVMLIGHVTKEGMLAGPRVLEHMVDTVLYFEGERYNALRLLRAVKNRFGSTNEIGVFEMKERGLCPVSASAYFLGQRHDMAPGSAVTCVLQGTRPLLIEVQALVSPTSFGNARRLTSGYDYNRLLLIIAVLERKVGLRLGDKDIYLNIAGGLRLDDPAADLAAAAAIVSSAVDRPLDKDVLLLGEIGLLSELRGVSQEARRLKEAAAFGFQTAVCPESRLQEKPELRRITAADLNQALKILALA
ncbi:MAG: DNA repair protein RadA [Clostridia bacterium]|nr:DNA repair protein RadA [Clostridia bacterium]